jgi:hypothetical protein
MSKPAGKCVFCGGSGLTKGHVWPDWFAKYLPQSSHHLDITGEYHTITPGIQTQPYSKKLRQGDAGQRKPRNTCAKCNGGWISRLENAAIPICIPLFRDEPHIFDTYFQRLFATFMCLITCRVAFTNPETQAIPASDRLWLKNNCCPPPDWKIWVARYHGERADEHWCRHHGMQILTGAPGEEVGPYKCNTQVTTFVFGKICVNVFSSTLWPDFRGYRGVRLTRIWPPNQWPIEWSQVPFISDEEIIRLAESIIDADTSDKS